MGNLDHTDTFTARGAWLTGITECRQCAARLETEGAEGVITMLNELKHQYDQDMSKIRRLRQQIEDLETVELLPYLRKQYQGKYFKYENTMGDEKSWPVYSFCLTVTSLTEAIAHSFETIPGGESRFRMEKTGIFLFQTPITKREWSRALRAFKARVERLGGL